jgi:DNA-directed RNA polymerase specialized sigma24 family protein
VQGESACLGGIVSEENFRPMDRAIDPDPTPDLEAMLIDELRRLLGLLNEPMQLVATRKLDGWSNAEIAQELGCSLATVERRLKMIREIWNHHGKSGESSGKPHDSSSS